MTFGMAVRDATGKLIFDTSSMTFSYIDSIRVEGGAAGSKAYPELAGWTLYPSQTQDSTVEDPSIDLVKFTALALSVAYTGGYPTLHWSPASVVGAAQVIEILVIGN
jgi:hypothetical protein